MVKISSSVRHEEEKQLAWAADMGLFVSAVLIGCWSRIWSSARNNLVIFDWLRTGAERTSRPFIRHKNNYILYLWAHLLLRKNQRNARCDLLQRLFVCYPKTVACFLFFLFVCLLLITLVCICKQLGFKGYKYHGGYFGNFEISSIQNTPEQAMLIFHL